MHVLIPIGLIGALVLLVVKGKAHASGFLKAASKPDTPTLPPGVAVKPSNMAQDVFHEIQRYIANGKKIASTPKEVVSPIDGISSAKWLQYERTQRSAGLNTISPNYNLGLYLMNMRTLADLGLADNPHKDNYNGKQVWKADWRKPYTLEGFLSNAKLQMDTFAKLARLHAKTIQSRFQDWLGIPLNDQGSEWEKAPVTLSGLMAVAKQAGLGGLEKWLSSTPDKRFASTSEAYRKANGVF